MEGELKRRAVFDEFSCGWALPSCSCQVCFGFTYKALFPLRVLRVRVLDDSPPYKVGASLLISLLSCSADLEAPHRERGFRGSVLSWHLVSLLCCHSAACFAKWTLFLLLIIVVLGSVTNVHINMQA